MAKFGQKVWIKVEGEGGEVVLDASDLRIDFDIRLLDGFRRGSFTIFGLTPETVGNVSNGVRYVTLKTQLHGGRIYTLANKWFVSNALEVTSVPDSRTTLYCFDRTRKDYLEKMVSGEVINPTLRRQVSAITRSMGYMGSVRYKHFPPGRIDEVPLRPIDPLNYSAQRWFRELQKEFKFNLYTEDEELILMYKPNYSDFKNTTFFNEEADIQLDSRNMRANPIIGPASLIVTSNLDPNIKPASVMDISTLVTYGVKSDRTLELAGDFLDIAISGFTKYLTIQVQHTGSNWTKQWHTKASAYTVTKGKSMSTGEFRHGT